MQETLRSLRYQEIGELFRAHRMRILKKSIEEVTERLEQFIRANKDLPGAEKIREYWSESPDKKEKKHETLLKHLEAADWPETMSTHILENELMLIACAYDLRPHLLRPLIAEDVDPFLSIQSLALPHEDLPFGGPERVFTETRIPPALAKLVASEGRDKDRYFHATSRVPGSGVAVVQLLLDAGGRSGEIAHIGSELIICLEGEVQIKHESEGGELKPLGPGSCVHFYAGERHRLLNNSASPARVIILRFLKEPTVREEGEDPRPGYVVDYAGLRRMLNRLLSATFLQTDKPLSHRGLIRRAHAMEPKMLGSYVHETISKLISGTFKDVSAEDLEEFANVFRVEPVLFYEFLKRPRKDLVSFKPLTGNRMRTVDGRFSRSSEIAYRIPEPRLASDVSIAVIEMNPHSRSRPNQHPGHEILIPIEGSATVEILDCRGKYPLVARQTFSIFESRRDHVVCNDSDQPAKVMVLRCFGTQPEVREKKPPNLPKSGKKGSPGGPKPKQSAVPKPQNPDGSAPRSKVTVAIEDAAKGTKKRNKPQQSVEKSH